MFVTCYYDIYNNPSKVEQYFEWFYPLGMSGISIHVYTDPVFVGKFKDFPNTVEVFPISLNELIIYTMGSTSTCRLPSIRNNEKDTREYISLQNTKIEFILRSSNRVQSKQYIWIDFGVLKLIKNKDLFIRKLKYMDNLDYDKITFPGCWDINTTVAVDRIHWRFCGTFIIVPSKLIDEFYLSCSKTLQMLIMNPDTNIIWETNVWAIIEQNKPDIFTFYSGDHNDNILPTFPEIEH